MRKLIFKFKEYQPIKVTVSLSSPDNNKVNKDLNSDALATMEESTNNKNDRKCIEL